MMKRVLTLSLIVAIYTALLASCSRNVSQTYNGKLPRVYAEKEGVLADGLLGFIDAMNANGIDMHSLMVLRRGQVVAEAYRYPYDAKYRHIMHSVSKTFTSTAIGFAVQEKLLTVDDKVISFFPGDMPAEVSPYLEELSVKHLLTMSVGQEPAPTFYMTDTNWVRSFLATPIVNKPGSKFEYSSYATYMLSAIIQKLTGMTCFDYLKPRLLDPLGITDAKWEEGAQDITAGGWGMRIHTEDMAKLGLFYLQEGKWAGQQLLDKDWIKKASSVQIFQSDETTSLEQEGTNESIQGYGYQIWRCTHGAYRADGANGQFIIVMPKEEAVVVITENTGKTQLVLQLVFEHIQANITDLLHRSEPDTREQLFSALNSMSVPDPFRTPEDAVILKDTVLSYSFAANEDKVSQASFSFDGSGVCRMQLTQDGKEYDFMFGQDQWRMGETDRLSPYFASPRRNPKGLAPFPVAGYGSVTAEGELLFRLLYLEDYQTETFRLRFNKGTPVFTLNDKQLMATNS
jgi:CubicO group peptidase (beta-lactamase class C family)